MRLLPATNFGRLVLLIGGVVLATLLIALGLLRSVNLSSGGEQVGDLLANQVVAARALMAMPQVPRDVQADPGVVLDFRMQTEPPATARPPMIQFVRQIASRLRLRLGDAAELRIEEAPESRLWIYDEVSGRWLGIRSPPFRWQATVLTASIATAASLLVVLAAAFFARSLTRPLERLADAAAGIAVGERANEACGIHASREVKQLESALHHAADAVRRTARERELLLAGISHDVRTPLARLRLLHEMHPSGDIDADQAMVRNVTEIDGLVAQFSDFARDGREESIADIDPLELLNMLRTEAAERGMVWQLETHGEGSPFRGRRFAVQRALRNLMINAERHGAAPRRLRLSVNSQTMALAVLDAGKGIDEAEWSRLLRPFERGHNTAVAGSGLGMAIAERVAHTHGGRLIRCKDEAGFCVMMELPLNSPA